VSEERRPPDGEKKRGSVRRRLAILLAGTLLFSFFFYLHAYVCDDAFLTLRVVDNFVRGHGLRWNVAERVQIFTSPLHTFVLSGAYYFAHDRSLLPNPNRAYFASLFVSYAASLATVLLLLSWLRRPLPGLALLVLLSSSRAFLVFTSSGLETPLTYLLLALFYIRFLRKPPETSSGFLHILLVAGLAVLNRLDVALLVALPVLSTLAAGWRRHGAHIVGPVLAGASPLLAWFAFSLVYYGFFLPNPYCAKIDPAIDQSILNEMGRAYLLLGLRQDPITLVVIGLGVLLSLRRGRTALAGISCAAYLFYVYRIGGDFIGFRFLAPPFLIASLVIIMGLAGMRRPHRTPGLAAAIAALLAYGVLFPSSPLRSLTKAPVEDDVRFYYEGSALSRWRLGMSFPFTRYHKVQSCAHCRALRETSLSVEVPAGGLLGFCRGPQVHLVTPTGIGDPLISRLPARVEEPFYPGHLLKPLPAGYMETLSTGENRIVDPDLAAYYEEIHRITRGPLFSKERWSSIAKLNFTGAGRYRREYVPATPPLPRELMTPIPSIVDRLRDETG